MCCRQSKLDQALLSSGRVSDALQSLLDWLLKAEVYLGEDQPVLGDLDTVSILTEQHKVSLVLMQPCLLSSPAPWIYFGLEGSSALAGTLCPCDADLIS